jgi:hypothetical protein
MLDAILSPEWEDRYYSFNSKWGPGEILASMRDGSGDEYFTLLSPGGAILKGFAHESPMSPYSNKSGKTWPGVIDDVPVEFRALSYRASFFNSGYGVLHRTRDENYSTASVALQGLLLSGD